MQSSTDPILITGAGLITPVGLSRAQTWEAVRAGRCGMGVMSAMESPLPAGADGGQAPDLPADFAPQLPRESRYLRYAVLQAMRDAGIDQRLPCEPHRVGLVLGTTLHGMRAGGEFFRRNDPTALRDFLAGAVVRNACGDLPFHGGAMTTCSACSSSLGAIAIAVTLLRNGELDLIVAGGYDTISEYVWGGFNSLRLVALGAPRPFTRGREGMKLAEGYGIVVLERGGNANTRGARAIATVLGFGESADAHHLTQPHPAGDGAARAMEQALASAGLTPADIDLVAAHATGTPDNDAAEFAALSRVFGAELPRVPVVAFKSHLGHTLGGAGAVELILAATAMQEQIVPACANVTAEDVEFTGLNLATGASKPAQIRATLNTSLGFGGANTCVILGPPPAREGEAPAEPGLSNERTRASDSIPSGHEVGSPESATPQDRLNFGKLSRAADSQSERGTHGAPIAKPQAPPTTAPPADDYFPCAPEGNARSQTRLGGSLALPSGARPFPRDVFITGIGVVLPGAIGNDAFLQRLASGADPLGGDIPDADIAPLLNARRVRRMSQYVKLSLAATVLCLQDAGIIDIPAFARICAAVLGTMHGSTNYCEQYYGQIVREGVAAANPMLFAEGVPNAAAAHLSLMLSLKGPCQTIIGTLTAGLDALRVAAARIATGKWDRAIVGAAEEFSPTVNDAHARCESSIAPGVVIGSGAVTFLLENRASMDARAGRPRGRVTTATSRMTPGGALAARALREVAQAIRSPTALMDPEKGDTPAYSPPERRSVPLFRAQHRAIGECFSVGPMAEIAAALLADIPPEGTAPNTAIGAIATDPVGIVAAVGIEPMNGSPRP